MIAGKRVKKSIAMFISIIMIMTISFAFGTDNSYAADKYRTPGRVKVYSAVINSNSGYAALRWAKKSRFRYKKHSSKKVTLKYQVRFNEKKYDLGTRTRKIAAMNVWGVVNSCSVRCYYKKSGKRHYSRWSNARTFTASKLNLAVTDAGLRCVEKDSNAYKMACLGLSALHNKRLLMQHEKEY